MSENILYKIYVIVDDKPINHDSFCNRSFVKPEDYWYRHDKNHSHSTIYYETMQQLLLNQYYHGIIKSYIIRQVERNTITTTEKILKEDEAGIDN